MSNTNQGKVRTAKAQEMLRDHLRDNPRMSLTEAMRWLNNQRYAGERMGVNWLEAQKIFDSLKRAPPGEKPLPVEVRVHHIQKPLQAPFAEIARLSLAQPKPAEPPPAPPPPPAAVAPKHLRGKAAAVTFEARKRRVEELVLEHPEWLHAQVAAVLIGEFGMSIDTNIISDALKLARQAAGLPCRQYAPRKEKKDMPTPTLVAPAPQAAPDELLKEAGRVLKALAARMQWASVTVKVTHDGSLSYSSEPLPQLALKGELKL